MHEDMTEAARLAKVDFIVNVVDQQQGRNRESLRGRRWSRRFSKAVKAVDEMYRVTVDRRADIVVVSCRRLPSGHEPFSSLQGSWTMRWKL